MIAQVIQGPKFSNSAESWPKTSVIHSVKYCATKQAIAPITL